VLCLACSSSSGTGQESTPSLLPANFQSIGFAQTRACRSPGEHSALGGFTVWVNNDALEAFQSLWAGEVGSMPSGALVLKEIYADANCDHEKALFWVVMHKERGFDPAHGDWHWQQIDKTGVVSSDGRSSACIGCHQGTGSCMGFGADASKDYLCTEP
jgi:hypothetical protein